MCKNLQNPANAIEIAKLRLGKTFTTKKSASDALKFDLHGRRHQHTLIMNDPNVDLSAINIAQLEIFPCEPLHDSKGLVKKSFKHIPGSIDSESSIVKIVKTFFLQIITLIIDILIVLKHACNTLTFNPLKRIYYHVYVSP